MINLIEHFRHDDKHHAQAQHQRNWFIKAREDKEKREESAEKLEGEMLAYASDTIAASALQLQQFEMKLEKYETATVTALMVNQKKLNIVNAQINEMLSRAYVMEDGRRVFKTEDGSQVFDEHGQEVNRDELDYDLIDASRPTWEERQAKVEARDNLLAERNNILEYQDRLDAARDRIADGDISEDELEALDAELLDVMPESVQAHVPGMEKQPASPELAGGNNEPTMRQTSEQSGNNLTAFVP